MKRGIAISPSFLSWVEVGGTSKEPALAGSGVELLPEGLVNPSFARENIPDRSGMREVLNKVVPVGKRSGLVSLTIPDAVLKISYLNFDELPKKREEVERLILWRLKKNIPLAPEMAKVDYVICPPANDSIDIIAAVASRKVLREYEDLLTDTGFKPNLVDILSMNLLNFFMEQLKGNYLFLAVNDRSIAISVIEKGLVKLFRHKEMEIKEDRIIKEVFATVTYYKSTFPESPVDSAYLFIETEKIQSKITERLSASFDGNVSELNMAAALGRTGDTPIPGYCAAAIGGALRLK